MNFLLNSHDLGKALEVVTAAVSSHRNEHIAHETVPHADLLYYDNHSLSRELKVSERTLQRYRKEGKIRSTVIGGKVYYPKNFLILPGEEPERAAPVRLLPKPAQPDWRQKIQAGPPLKPKSRIIDLVRVTWYAMKMISYKRRYRGDTLQVLHERVRLERRIRGCSIQLWPKKIRLTYIPIRRPRNPLLDF